MKIARIPWSVKYIITLFIAARATQAYKNGCGGWEHDDATQQEAEKLLKQRYASSPWTTRLRDSEK